MTIERGYRLTDSSGALSPAGARHLARREDHLAVEAQYANDHDIAQAMLAGAAFERFTELARRVRAAVDEDPINLVGLDILTAYKDGAVRRINGFR